MSNPSTYSEIEMSRYIQQGQKDLNKFFKQMRFKPNQFDKVQANEPKQEQNKFPINNFSVNYRGQKIYSIKDLKQNYQNMWFGFKWLTLPYGRRNIFGKLQFWFGASFIFTFMWASHQMRKQNVKSLHWKFYRNSYAMFALGSTVFVFAQSLMFQPYCDINSYHYRTDQNIYIARDIKDQLKNLKV